MLYKFGTRIVSILLVIGFGLSLWIIIPAPIFDLLPLSVGAPEISPILVVANFCLLLLTIACFWWGKFKHRRAFVIALSIGSLALALSATPLLQFPTTQNQAARSIRLGLRFANESALGKDYLQQFPPEIAAKLRSQPLQIADSWRGIPIPTVRVERRIPFANPDGVTLTLNIYRPANVGKYPAIVSIYGGAWQRGSPDSDDTFNRYIAAQGYVVWAISYRHAPAYRFPSQIEDIKTGLAFIRERAAQYETDLDRVAIIGRSAGAQLAMLAAYRESPFPIHALINYYSPVDLTTGYENVPTPDPIESRSVLRAFLGGTPTEFPQLYAQASPINAVKPGLPPSLLIYGGKDHIIESKYGRALADKLRSQGNRVVFIEIPWADHSFDAVFSGLSNQLALYYTERFLAWTLWGSP